MYYSLANCFLSRNIKYLFLHRKKLKQRIGNGLFQGDPLSEVTEIRIDSASQILTQTGLQISITCPITLARLRTPQGHSVELKVTRKVVL